MLILLVTFFLTIIFDLVIAIEVGIVLSSFVVMRKMSQSMSIENAEDTLTESNGERLFDDELPALPEGLAIYEIRGALFFGVAQLFQDTINNLQKKPKVLILRMRHVPFIDATGVYRLKEVIKQFSDRKVTIILSGVNKKIREDLENADIYSVLSKDNLLDHISSSLQRANEVLAQ